MERHRVSELFGAVGNLHMTVFEILFKHAYITRMPTLLGLESGLESFKEATRKKRPASYAKTRFQRFRRLFERAFSQLLELQQHQNHQETEMSHIQKIDAGQFTCRNGDLFLLTEGTEEGFRFHGQPDGQIFGTGHSKDW